eukprot:gene14150-3914_t
MTGPSNALRALCLVAALRMRHEPPAYLLEHHLGSMCIDVVMECFLRAGSGWERGLAHEAPVRLLCSEEAFRAASRGELPELWGERAAP